MWTLSAFLLVAALCTACDGSPAERDDATVAVEVPESVLARRAAALGLPAGVTLRTAARGRGLYDGSCIACHGPAGTGTQLGPSLADTVHIHTDGSFEQTVEVIRAGVAEPREFPVPMPPLGGGRYDAEQVRALAAYVLALKGGR
jgi:mono/diheme cytochrome c family protein